MLSHISGTELSVSPLRSTVLLIDPAAAEFWYFWKLTGYMASFCGDGGKILILVEAASVRNLPGRVVKC